MSLSDTKQQTGTLWQRIKELITLKLEYTKYTVAEKLTMLLAMAALGFIGLLLAAFILFFLSVALSHWMAESIGSVWSSVIVAGIYIVLLVLIIALRKPLFIDPVSKFISRMML